MLKSFLFQWPPKKNTVRSAQTGGSLDPSSTSDTPPVRGPIDNTSGAPGIVVWPFIETGSGRSFGHAVRIRGIDTYTDGVHSLASELESVRQEMAESSEPPTLEALEARTRKVLERSDLETYCVQNYDRHKVEDGWTGLPPVAWYLGGAKSWVGPSDVDESTAESAGNRQSMSEWMAMRHSK